MRIRPALDSLLFPVSSRTNVSVVSVGHSAVGSWLPHHLARAGYHSRRSRIIFPLASVLSPLLLPRTLAVVPTHVRLRHRQVDIGMSHVVVFDGTGLALRVPMHPDASRLVLSPATSGTIRSFERMRLRACE